MTKNVSLYRTHATVITEYQARAGRGAMVRDKEGKNWGVGAFDMPQDFKVGDQVELTISFGRVIDCTFRSKGR